MAKSGFWLRGARGKLAGAVLAKGADGQTIMREKVTPKNPQTNGQMAQRMIFATVVSAYSKMKAITDHSFEGVQYGAKTQQAFMKENLAIMRNRASEDEGNFLIPNIGVLMANPYLVSKGSLTSVRGINIDGTVVLPETLDGANEVTVATFCSTLGINKGDQITIVAITDEGGNPVGTYAGRDYRNYQFRYCRITVNANADDNDIVISDNVIGNGVIVENIEGEGENNGAGFSWQSTEIYPTRVDSTLAMAVIRSAKNGDSWLRSTEYLTLNDEMLVFNFNDILPAWKARVTPLYVGGARYLNNAEQEALVESASLTNVPIRAIDDEQAESVTNVAVIHTPGNLLFDGCVVVDNLTDNHPYFVETNGTLTKLSALTPVNKSQVITLENAAKLLGYTPTVNS